MMTFYSADKSPLMQVHAIERDGSHLLIKGKVFGTMPMTARLTPAEARQGLRLLRPGTFLFLLSMLFRK